MESLKELFTPKAFNKLSYVPLVCWIALGVLLLGIFADMENSESRFDFSCGTKMTKSNKDLIEGKCLEQYNKQYNKLGIPVYSYVIMNFSVIAFVAVIYSQIVKSRVNGLKSSNPEPEGQVPQGNPTSRRLFAAYICQLALRISLGIIFIVLQTQVLYPYKFPSNFKCSLMARAVNNSVNSSINVTQVYECHSQRATKKTFWTNAVSVINGTFAFLVFIEIVLILSRLVRKGKPFMEDTTFYADHLEPKIPLQTFFQRMKNTVIENTEHHTDLKQPIKRPNPGEGSAKDLKIDTIYTNLKIQEGRAKYDFPKDRHEQLKVYPQSNMNKSDLRPEDIIDAKHKNILVVGRPGIGKTLFCTKLLRDWAFGRAFNKEQNLETCFDAAFLLKFRRFSGAESINLRELLCASEYSTNLDEEVWNYILQNPTKVLLVFDGIDEFPTKSKIANDYRNTTVEEKMPLHALYNKIASGRLLKGATLITTTRPTAVSCVNDLHFDRTVEILGFSSEQVQEYVEKFTRDEKEKGEKMWQHISSHMNIFSFCYIPVNCFIVCHCLLQLLTNSISVRNLPTKLTDIYSIAIKMFFFKHNRDDKYSHSKTKLETYVHKEFDELQPENDEVFKKLGKIAFDGINERRLIFGTSEVNGLEDCGLLHRLPDQAGPRALKPNEAQYCFTHLTVQEFLAAKHVIDTKDDEQIKKFVCDKIEDGAWQVVIQFVAGLLGEREVPTTHVFADLLPVKTEQTGESELTEIYWNETSKERHKLTCWPAQRDKYLALNLCKCLLEIDENDTVIQQKLVKIDFNAVDFSTCSIGPVDCAAIVHLLKNVKGILCINLGENNIGPLGCTEILKLIDNSDHDKNNYNVTSLNLAQNNITDEGVTQLADALKHSECKLTHLDLAGNSITDEGVTQLADALKHSECKLTHLNLAFNNITDEGVTQLADALKHSECKLTHLDLAVNNITDEGVTQLADALKHSECKLTNLNLFRNNITDKGVTQLADALKHSECKLTHLDLAVNNITDEGVTQLADALKHSECKLTHLDLAVNNITDEGVTQLADALKHSECKLTNLNLFRNNITDKGVTQLADALKHSECKLTYLNLRSNNITDEGVTQLADALKHSECKLIHLYLGSNNITDKGVTQLTDALKHSECKLTHLNLAFNNITDEGVTQLADALKHSECKLTYLDLAVNNITDEGVTQLADALKHSECKLTNLNLFRNNITDKGVTQLADALKHSECKLTYLNLRSNNITDEGVTQLADALKHSECKLTHLYLGSNNITDKGVTQLADALKHSECKLTHLYLGSNNITDKGVTQLADALKHSECKLTYLDLMANNITDEGKKLLAQARSLKTEIVY